MPALPTLAVILPCLDGCGSLDRTLHSLAEQTGPFRLHCHAVWAGQQDDTAPARQLDWWQAQLRSGRRQVGCAGLALSHGSAAGPGSGLAGCLATAIEACPADSVFSWMLPGSTLPPDSLQTVAEAMQQFAPEQLSWLSSACAAPLPEPVLQAGLSDGTHWEALPCAGTFFRPWLWHKAALDPALQDPDPGTAAWALWGHFSQHAGLVQLPPPAASGADPLLPETAALEALLPASRRRAALADLAELAKAGTSPAWRRLSRCPEQGSLVISSEDALPALARHCNILTDAIPGLADLAPQPPRELARARRAQASASASALAAETGAITFQNNILAYDSGWQYPAITEQHAYRQLAQAGAVPDGITYLAYPWATLIDKLHRKTADLPAQLAQFRAFCARVPQDTIKVTVCQHIKMKEELELLRLAGVTEIFWSHATHTDAAAAQPDGLRLHPFPLYPVQATGPETAAPPGNSEERPLLFSFIGARANQHYLTGSRNWILDLLQDDPRGQITGRGGWHYNKVVYSHQIHAPDNHSNRGDGGSFVDGNASEEFRASLKASVFSLCPSGTGPNSIRLWESLGLGAVPVILADSWAPPGNPALWQAGAVFCEETPEAIRALPERLAALAADPDALERLRHGGRQLWALYGPDCFIYDLQKSMLEAAARPPVHKAKLLGSLQAGLTRPQAEPRSPAAAALYLSSLSSRLLLDGTAALDSHRADPLAQAAEAAARAALAADHPLAGQLDRTQALLQRRAGLCPAPAAAPARIRRGPVRVCLTGKHANRTPLAYAPFQSLVRDRITLAENLQDADIMLTGFSADLREMAPALQAAQQQNPDLQLAVLSEEPLWDSIWNNDLMSRHQQMEAGGPVLDYHVFNHSNSAIFDFETIPYFLLTRTGFAARYALGLARHARLSPAALLQHWRAAPVPAAFYAEVRDTAAYSRVWPEQQVEGLSVYRTDVARLTELPGSLREGRGWRPGAKRQALADWHLDKLAALDMRSRVIAAYENTHQHAYISEKLFDAFLAGGMPVYYAGPGHRVHELVPEAAMINTFGLDAAEAAARITAFSPDWACAEAWLETAHQLQARFSNLEAIAHERRRIAGAVTDAVESCLP
ncbi:hypothetical protein AB838_22145 [Rhodobacteraceae bacterium (ex Bugula neritina AB1)]|nr:hypothetical protein AB838_22145 [Rhodobacteraceae bacterium (ex Bugula neritina AB1)]